MRPARRYCGLSVETGSFISVKSLTVKQPLPLPQGVSDYAVGNSILTQKGFGMTVAPSSMAYKGIMREEGLEHKKENGLGLKPLITTPALEKMPIKLGTIAVTEGLSKESIQRVSAAT